MPSLMRARLQRVARVYPTSAEIVKVAPAPIRAGVRERSPSFAASAAYAAKAPAPTTIAVSAAAGPTLVVHFSAPTDSTDCVRSIEHPPSAANSASVRMTRCIPNPRTLRGGDGASRDLGQ